MGTDLAGAGRGEYDKKNCYEILKVNTILYKNNEKYIFLFNLKVSPT